MGWNGSDRRGNTAPVKPKVTAKKPSPIRGVVAGLIVVAAVCVAYFVFFSGSERPQEEKDHKGHGRIKEVVPVAAPTNKVEVSAKPAKPKELPPQKLGETRNGYIMLPNGKLHKVVGVITNSSTRIKGKYAIFDHKSENEIAMLLTVKPGSIIGPAPNWNGGFTKDFLESLKEPIIPSHEDTPENAELKRAVRDAKIELKAAYDRGEDIEKIIRDERAGLQKLMQFKDQITSEVEHYRMEHPEASDEDVEDYCNAANKLLESKGIAPSIMGPITKANFRMAYKMRRAEQQKGMGK